MNTKIKILLLVLSTFLSNFLKAQNSDTIVILDKSQIKGLYIGVDLFGKTCSYPPSLNIDYRSNHFRYYANFLYIFKKRDDYFRTAVGFDYFPFKKRKLYLGIGTVFSMNFRTINMSNEYYNEYIEIRMVGDDRISVFPDSHDIRYQLFGTINLGYIWKLNNRFFLDFNSGMVYSTQKIIGANLVAPFLGLGIRYKIL